MLIPDQIRKCVVFLGYRWTNGPRLAGTAFVVGIELADTPLSVAYLVTAKHVIDAIHKNSSDGKAFVRYNTKEGGSEIGDSDCVQWIAHPTDKSVDVVVHPFAMRDQMDHLMFPQASFLSATALRVANLTEQDIDVGDDVFLTGLFVNHFGKERNIPIVRVGNIAAMPEDRISTQSFGDIEAYLVEARSIGGLSGSPVFVLVGNQRRSGSIVVGNSPLFLLGLMHGHFDLPQPATDAVISDATGTGSINVGIGIVVPSSKIAEVLNQPKLAGARDQIRNDWIASHPSIS